MKMVLVEIDSVLTPIIPDFLDSRRHDCVLIGELLAAGCFDEIETLGHRMKGAGGSFGFDDITIIGEQLEAAAALLDRSEIEKQKCVLEEYLQSVTVIYV